MKRFATLIATAAAALAIHLPAVAEAGPKVVFVSPVPIGVNDYLKLGALGSKNAAEKAGGTVKVFESVDPMTRKRDLDNAAKEGADVVVSLGFEFTDFIQDVATAYPKTTFLAVDYCPKNPAANIHCVFVREQEMSFLAGAEAAWLNPTGTFAMIGGVDIPLLHRYTDGFADGVKYASPDATIKPTQWIGGNNPFSDPARASQMASALYFDGVDTILVAAGASGGGVINAAKSMPGKLAVGADANHCPIAPGAVLDNVEKRADRMIEFAFDMLLANKLPQTVSFGLKEGAVTLSSLEGGEASQCTAAANAEVVTKVKALRQDIIDGKVTVKDPMNP